MNKILLGIGGIILAAAIIGSPAFAQEQPAKRALAAEMLNLMKMNETMEQVSASMKQMAASQIAQTANRSQAAQDQSSQMMDMIIKEMSWDNMKEDYITLYAETFTEDELKSLIAFYKSPAGQALVNKTPELTKKGMELSAKRMQLLLPKLMSQAEKAKSLPENKANQP